MATISLRAPTPPVLSGLATIEEIAPRPAPVPDGLLSIETCTSEWLFDENLRLFSCISNSAPPEEVPRWRRYDRLIAASDSEFFVVFLDPSGTRLLRSRRHRAPCPRCPADAQQRRSREDLRRVARG